MGAIAEYTSSGKLLTAIDGIGEQSAKVISDACERWFKDNPQDEDRNDEEEDGEEE